MCRSIKPLRRADSDTTTGEIEAAALQFVRKVSSYRTPSTKNQGAFDEAVAEIAAASQRMLETLGVEVVDGPEPLDEPDRRDPLRGSREHAHDQPHPHARRRLTPPGATSRVRGPRRRAVVDAAGSRAA